MIPTFFCCKTAYRDPGNAKRSTAGMNGGIVHYCPACDAYHVRKPIKPALTQERVESKEIENANSR